MDRPRPPPPPASPSGSRSPVSIAANIRERQETRLVIGLDYGTTYTGKSFCL